MKKNYTYFFIIIFLLTTAACSTQKNTPQSRLYQAFTTRYNVYFNGKQAFDEALKKQIENFKESYTKRIVFHPVTTIGQDKQEQGGEFDLAIEKGKKSIQLHSIQVKPEKKRGWRNNPKQVAFQNKKEYNPFLQNAWFLIAESQFYNGDFLEAWATFSYITRLYSNEPKLVAKARLWQARCYAELGWLYESEMLLKSSRERGDSSLHPKIYATVYANYLIKSNHLEEAIPYFNQAIKYEKNRRQKARMYYLKGQIEMELNHMQDAYQSFRKVTSYNPPFKLELSAQLRQVEASTDKSKQAIERKLKSLSRHPKNKDFLDQVYFAEANFYLSLNDTTKAIQALHSGIDKSVKKGMDMAFCCLKLGDLYYAKKEYWNAQPQYSQAISILNDKHPDFKRISHLSSILDELVIHSEAVHLQDSLQELARMPEKERLAAIDKIIQEVKRKEKEEERLKLEMERDSYMAQQMGESLRGQSSTTNMPSLLGNVSSGGFYFYNSQALNQGKVAFQQKWGRRPLTDDWRRRNKKRTQLVVGYVPGETKTATSDTISINTQEKRESVDTLALQETGLSNDPKTREFYLQQIPFEPEDIEASNLIIIDGLYNMGRVFETLVEDLNLAVDAYEELLQRFPNNEWKKEAFYHLFLSYSRLGNTAKADFYRKSMFEAFPNDDLSTAIKAPNYLESLVKQNRIEEDYYQKAYALYLKGDTTQVRKITNEIVENHPTSKLKPKFLFLKALTFVQSGEPLKFKNDLEELITDFPEEDVSILAGEMLKSVLRGRDIVGGDFSALAWDMIIDAKEQKEDIDSLKFAPDTIAPYSVAMLFQKEMVNENALLFQIASFNFSEFKIKRFDLNFIDDANFKILKIEGMNSVTEAANYYRKLFASEDMRPILEKGIITIPISLKNLDLLLQRKNLGNYISSFNEYFGELLPEFYERSLQTNIIIEEEKQKSTKEKDFEQSNPLSIDSISIISKADTMERVPLQNNINKIEDTEEAKEKNILSIVAPTKDEHKNLSWEEVQKIKARENFVKDSLAQEEERLKIELKNDKKEKQEKASLKDKKRPKRKSEAQIKREQRKKIATQKRLLKKKEAERKKALKKKEKERKKRLKVLEKERKEKLRKAKAERKAKEKNKKKTLKRKN